MINLFEKDSIFFSETGLVRAERRDPDDGNLTSIGPQIVSLPKFTQTFVFNEHRKAQFNKLRNWVSELHTMKVNILAIWMGGSFIELKENPSDIDLLLIYTAPHLSNQKCNFLDKAYTENTFGLDLHILDLEKHPGDVVHTLAMYTMYFSHPTAAKLNKQNPLERKAIISLPGSELKKLISR